MVSGTGCITRRSRPRAAQTGGFTIFAPRRARQYRARWRKKSGYLVSSVVRRCVEQQQRRSEGRRHAYGRGRLRLPLDPPPTTGLCNSRLCVGYASVHAIAAPVLGGPEGSALY